jgi:desulfoferrodoxin-like iron-binding protein
MTNKGEVYFCEICGNKVQVLEEGAGNSGLLWTRHDLDEVKATGTILVRDTDLLPFRELIRLDA